MTLVLRDREVSDLVTMSDAVAALREAMAAEARGRALYAERSNLRVPGGWMRMAPAALLDEGVVGYKEFHLAGGGIRFTIRLFDAATGAPLAEMDGRHLTAVRTGASGGLGVDALAPPGPAEVAVIGSSDTAFRQLEGAAAVRPLRAVRVFSPNPANREALAARAGADLGLAVEPVASAQAAVDGAGVLLVATDTKGRGPCVGGDLLRPGLHVNSIGSTLPDQREVDEGAWKLADRIVVDTLGVLRDSGDALAAVAAGVHEEDRVATLADVLAGDAPGRGAATDVTLYKSVGTSAQDVAVALVAYRRATADGRGTQVADFVSVKQD